jgi:hypothetical protein
LDNAPFGAPLPCLVDRDARLHRRLRGLAWWLGKTREPTLRENGIACASPRRSRMFPTSTSKTDRTRYIEFGCGERSICERFLRANRVRGRSAKLRVAGTPPHPARGKRRSPPSPRTRGEEKKHAARTMILSCPAKRGRGTIRSAKARRMVEGASDCRAPSTTLGVVPLPHFVGADEERDSATRNP